MRCHHFNTDFLLKFIPNYYTPFHQISLLYTFYQLIYSYSILTYLSKSLLYFLSFSFSYSDHILYTINRSSFFIFFEFIKIIIEFLFQFIIFQYSSLMKIFINLISKITQYHQIISPLLYFSFLFELFFIQLLIIYPFQHYMQSKYLLKQFLNILHLITAKQWFIITILYALFSFIFQFRVTVLRAFYLISIFSALKEFQLDKIGVNILLIIITIILLIVQIIQNVDSSFSSDCFLKQEQNITKVYASIIKIILSISSALNLKFTYFYLISVTCTLFLSLRRFFKPYSNPILQNIDLLIKIYLMIQTIFYLSISFYGQFSISLLNLGLSLSIIPAVLIFYSINKYATNKFNAQFEINQSFFEKKSIHLFHLFYDEKISAQLQRLCNKINRFIQLQRKSQFTPLQQKLTIQNKKKWAVYIYDIISYQMRNTNISFDHYINFSLMEFYYKKNWIKSIFLLEKAKNFINNKQNIIQNTLKSAQFIKIYNLISNYIKEIQCTNVIPFKQFQVVNQIVQQMNQCSNSYIQLWYLLNQNQMYIQNIIKKTSLIKQIIGKIEQKLQKLNFKSNLLAKICIQFYFLILSDPEKGIKIYKNYQKNIEIQCLVTDIKDYIYIQFSLEKKNIGQILKIGINQNLLKSRQTQLKPDHINDILPISIKNFHSINMLEQIYNQKQYKQFFPFDKKTYCISENYLKIIDISLKPNYKDNIFSAYGFMRQKIGNQNLYLLIQKPSGLILYITKQLERYLRLYKNREQLRISKLFSGIQQEKLFELWQQNNSATIEDDLGILSQFELKLKLQTILDKQSLCLVQLKKKTENVQFKIMKNILSQYIKVDEVHKIDYGKSKCTNTKSQRFFQKKKIIIQKYNIHQFKKIIIITFIFIFSLFALKIFQHYINQSQYQFKISYFLINFFSKQRYWMTKRMYIYFFYSNLLFNKNITFSSIQSTRNSTFTSIVNNLAFYNKQLAKFRDKNQLYNVNIDEKTSIFNTDMFKLQQQVISQAYLIISYDLRTTDQNEINILKLANKFIQINKLQILNFQQSNLFQEFVIQTQKYNIIYVIYYYTNMIIIIFILIILIMLLVKNQRQKNQMKEDVCGALLTFSSSDLSLFIEFSKQFLLMTKGYSINQQLKNSNRKEKIKTKNNDLILNTNYDILLTEDQMVFSKKHCNGTINEVSQNRYEQEEKIINKSQGYDKFAILIVVIFFGVMMGVEIYILKNEIRKQTDTVFISNQYKTLTDIGIDFADVIVKYFNIFAQSNFYNVSDSQSSMNKFLTRKQVILNIHQNQLNSLQYEQFNVMLDYYLYNSISSYMNTSNYINATSNNFENLVIEISTILNNSYNQSKLNLEIVDYLGWTQLMGFKIFSKLSQLFFKNSNQILRNNINVIKQFNYIGLIVISVYLLLYIWYIQRLYQKRKSNFSMLHILKESRSI